MLNLPLYYFLYFFFACLLAWLLISLAGLYHLLRFSANDRKAPFIAFLYLAGSAVMILLFVNFINTIDWQTELSLPAFGGPTSQELIP